MAETGKSSPRIRPFKPSDAPACRKLYRDGLLGGKLAPNDTGLDIDDIQGVYMRSPGSCFWVAESADGQIVGMVGVQHHEEASAEIRRLRGHKDHHQSEIVTLLLEQALRFCQEKQYLKVMLDTYMDRERAVALFGKYRYRLSRSRDVDERPLHYFYFDLYSGETRPKKS